MNDKQLIETLKNIRDYCKEAESCRDCKFHNHNECCLLCDVISTLTRTPGIAIWNIPATWNIEGLEELINEN